MPEDRHERSVWHQSCFWAWVQLGATNYYKSTKEMLKQVDLAVIALNRQDGVELKDDFDTPNYDLPGIRPEA